MNLFFTFKIISVLHFEKKNRKHYYKRKQLSNNRIAKILWHKIQKKRQPKINVFFFNI
jgi:hypothetical protein